MEYPDIMKLFLTTLMVCISTISYALPVTDEALNTAPLSLAIESSLLELEASNQATLPQEKPPQKIDNTTIPEEALIQKSFSEQNITGYACNISHTPSESTKWSILLYNFDNTDDSGTVVFSTNKNRKIQSVACTPDGEKVVFSFQESTQGDSEIYSLNTATKDVVKLTDNATDDVDVSMSKDGLVMAWQKRLTDDRQAITIRTYDKNSTSFTEKSLASAYPFVQPSLSANGDWLALVQMRTNNFLALRYDIMNSTFQTIHSIPRRKRLYHPSLSADGNIYGWVENKNQSRYVVKNILKNTETRLITGIEGIEHPFISQDGKRVIYSVGEQTLIKNIDSGVTEEVATANRFLGSYWLGDFKITGIEEIGSWGNNVYSKTEKVIVRENYAYIVEATTVTSVKKLFILDISDPSTIKTLGTLELPGLTPGYKFSVSNTMAYAFDHNIFVTIDISDPTKPLILKSHKNVSSYGNNYRWSYGLVFPEGDGLSYGWENTKFLMKLSDNGDLDFSHEIDLGMIIYSVDVSGSYAYAVGSGAFQIIDISDPTNMKVIKNHPTSSFVGKQIKISNGYAYTISEDNEILVFDVKDPLNPNIVRNNGFTKLTGLQDASINIFNNYVFLQNEEGMYILDISNPLSINLIGQYQASSLGEISIKGNFIYAADKKQGLLVLDYSDLENISLVSSFHISLIHYLYSNVTESGTTGVTTIGKYAYVTDDYHGLVILDISNPADPELVGLYEYLESHNIVAHENYIYVASRSGLQVIDISNPSSPIQSGSYLISAKTGMSTNSKIKFYDGYIYAHGLKIFNVNTKVVVPYTARFSNYPYHDFVVSADKVYLSHSAFNADDMGKFYIYEKDCCEHLWATFRVEKTGGSLNSMSIDPSNNLYTLDTANSFYSEYVNRLLVTNVSDPANPLVIAEFDSIDSTSNSMTIEGDFAYITDQYGLLVLDISNPAAPSVATSIDLDGEALSTTIHRQYIYMADGKKGLRVLKAH